MLDGKLAFWSQKYPESRENALELVKMSFAVSML